MASPRLTGLEFHWFGKGQSLALHYGRGGSPDLGASVAVLAAEVAEDAKESFTGPESLRRVAVRFMLDAVGVENVGPEAPLPSGDRRSADRHIEALRRLATDFEKLADTVDVLRRDRAHKLDQGAQDRSGAGRGG
jgi:hypothetical protein